MIAVIFEVRPAEGRMDAYLAHAARLREHLESIDGFISVERFRSITDPDKQLSLSVWRDEEAVEKWRQLEAHRRTQEVGRNAYFADYRLRVAGIIRDYGKNEREQAPADSRSIHG